MLTAMGVHPQNRGGNYPKGTVVKNLGVSIGKSGFHFRGGKPRGRLRGGNPTSRVHRGPDGAWESIRDVP